MSAVGSSEHGFRPSSPSQQSTRSVSRRHAVQPDTQAVWGPGLSDDHLYPHDFAVHYSNHSVPSLPSQQLPPRYTEHVTSPQPFDTTTAFDNFSSLRISDPEPRGASDVSYALDPVTRTHSSMSLHSSPNSQRILQPRHATTLPPPTAHAHAYTSPRYDGRPPSNGFEEQQGYHTGMLSYDDSNNLGHQSPFVQPSGFNPLYAAASDVLGMGPPPNSRIPLVPNYASIGSNSSVDTAFANSQAPSTMVSNASGHQSLPDSYPLPVATHLPDAHDFEPRPHLERAGTSASVNLTTYKSKAIDLSAPPFTKEYIDQYRHRIKADPDPEAHFLYAKYLIDAAKKIRASAKDQRTAKKYSELLIGESLKVIRRLATQGEAYDEAQFFLANCYGTGALGLQVDHERAYHLYLQAAKQNHAAASYRVAVCNEIGAGTRREPPRAAAFYRKAASLGDTPAMYKLGMILLQGLLGESKNQREAINWLKRAAEQADEENPHALHELALLHEQPTGTLVTYDPGYAKNLYTQAGQLGYTPSQYKLGQCYEYGSLTCPVDARRSIAWYTKAAEKGDAEAELALSGWYLTGSEGVLKQSDSEAYLWARRAANKGLSKAEYAVGYYAEVGIGIKQDIEFAKRWYMRAAAQGNKRAMNRLTEMKRMGTKRANIARPTRQQAKDECVVC